MKHVLLIVFLFMSIILNAQIEVGIRETESKRSELSRTQLIQLKHSKTTFVVPAVMETEIKSALEENWTITEWSISTDANHNITPDKENSIFTISVKEGPSPQAPIITLAFYMCDYTNEPIQIASILLQPKSDLIETLQILGTTKEKRSAIFENCLIHNATRELLGYNLNAINNLLLSGGSIWIDQDIANSSIIPLLKTEKLSIPSYCFFKRNMLNGKDEPIEHESLLKKYPYEWEKGTSETNRFVFLYSQSGAAIYASIYDKRSRKIIYHKRSMNQFKLSAKTFKLIASAID